MKKKLKSTVSDLNVKIVENIRQLMSKKNLSLADLSKLLDYDPAKMSKIMSYQQMLSLQDVENFSTVFNISVIDLITYPVHYVKEQGSSDPLVAVTIQVTKENRDLLLKFLS